MLPIFAILASLSPLNSIVPQSADSVTPTNIEVSPSNLEKPLLIAKPPKKTTEQPPIEFKIPQTVKALPGELDKVPVFNSNNPEIVRYSGILLSTFPDKEMRFPNAHLDYGFKGRFDIFSHHIAKSDYPESTPTLYLGILVKNASRKKKNVIDVLQAASYLGTPDAPYISLAPLIPNDVGRVFSGPGGRVSDVVLRGIRQTQWSPRLELEPDETVLLMNLPMPLPTLGSKPTSKDNTAGRLVKKKDNKGKPPKKTPSSNARSTLMRLKSKKEVYVASMAMFAPIGSDGREKIPTLEDWQRLLERGNLVQPRDRAPSELNSKAEKFYYGRVAGVSQGSSWTTQVTDTPKKDYLSIPEKGDAISYGIGTLQRGTYGTDQIQSAPMIVRYPDTAYLAHGNYGVHYQLTIPLKNKTKETNRVSLSFQTPIKARFKEDGLKFYKNPPKSVFFRGTVRLRYKNDFGTPQVRYFHLVQKRGELSAPLATVTLKPSESRLLKLDFVYPPDATPPQVITIKTE